MSEVHVTMANRAQRRAMMRAEENRAKALLQRYDKAQRIDQLMQNGISPKDLEETYRQGYNDGARDAGVPIVKSCYAGICLAMRERFGFGKKRLMRVLSTVDEKIMLALNNQELVDETFKKTGIELDFDAPFDRVTVSVGGKKHVEG